jgi:hypothetical protein
MSSMFAVVLISCIFQYDVIVLGELGGRLDHTAQSLNALYVFSPAFRSLTLLSGSCTARLLPAGVNSVSICKPMEGTTCGMVPLGAPNRPSPHSFLRLPIPEGRGSRYRYHVRFKMGRNGWCYSVWRTGLSFTVHCDGGVFHTFLSYPVGVVLQRATR